MARLRLLLSGLLACTLGCLIVLAFPIASAANSACLPGSAALGGCPTVGGEIVDGGVQLDGQVNVPGSGNSGGGDGSGGGNGSGASDDDDGANVPYDNTPVRSGYTVTGPVTLSDLVNFRPAPGTNHMEPDGWMIVGLDTNFYARSGTQVQSGMLLDEMALVRFTPVRYHWTYGDGTRASRSTPGGTWKALGIREFDPTPTSHIYRAPGTYYIDLTIDFAAEYTWSGSSWTSIAGTIPVPANRLVATAGGAKTVLVERECTLNPAGPGC